MHLGLQPLSTSPNKRFVQAALHTKKEPKPPRGEPSVDLPAIRLRKLRTTTKRIRRERSGSQLHRGNTRAGLSGFQTEAGWPTDGSAQLASLGSRLLTSEKPSSPGSRGNPERKGPSRSNGQNNRRRRSRTGGRASLCRKPGEGEELS